MLSWAERDLKEWDPRFRDKVTSAVIDRKRRLDATDALSEALTIPLIPIEPAQRVQVPVARKTILPITAREHSTPASGEPMLDETVYEDVLQTIMSLARAMERLPRTA